jgi:predicted MPP superfamily phosphohydrolase/tetratricopeptide (TPR) repeat protein
VAAIGAVYGAELIFWAVRINCKVAKRSCPPRFSSKYFLIIHIFAIAGILCFIDGFFIEPRWIEVTRVELETDKLKNTTLRIVLFSDTHCEQKASIEGRVVEIVNSLNPDVIIFGGDSLNTPKGLPLFKETLAAMNARLGKFAVRGNFDTHYWKELDLFSQTGFKELNAETDAVSKDGETFYVTGFNVPCPTDFNKELRNVPVEKYSILLYHYSDLAESLKGLNVDLYLSGHTHGGQVRLPFYGAPVTLSRFGKKYEAGMYTIGQTKLYVNRGIGLENKPAPKVRFLCRPEITVFELKPTGKIKPAGQIKPATSSPPEFNETPQNEIDSENTQAELLRTSGQVDEAIKLLQQALKKNPDYAKTHNNLGCALRDKGQLAEAAAEFEQAIKLDPAYVNAYNNLGVVLAEQKRYEEAIKCFGKVLALAPDFQSALNNLWEVGVSGEKMDEVLKVLITQEQIDPGNSELYYRVGVIYHKQKETGQAITQLEKAVQLRPDYAAARGILGDALLDAKRYSDAAKQYDASIRIDPNNPQVLSTYALLLAGSPDPGIRNLNLAVALAEEACSLTDYNQAVPLDVLSQVYFGKRELDSAIITAQKAYEAANREGQGMLGAQIKVRLQAYQRAKGDN